MIRFSFCSLVLVAVSFASISLADVVIIDDGPLGNPNLTEITWMPVGIPPGSNLDNGDWNYRPETGTNNKPNSYNGTGSRFALANSGASATYTPNLPTAGDYDVAIWWPTFDWGGDVPVTIAHSGGSTVMDVDQNTTNSGQWISLGTFNFPAGTSGNVTLGSDGIGSPGTSNTGPVADAVRFTNEYAVPLTAAAAYASSSISTGNRTPDHLIDLSGMSDRNGIFGPDTHAASNNGENINWMSDAGDPTGWVAVDLGAQTQLDRMEIFNFNTSNDRSERGVSLADVYVSSVDDPNIASPDFSDTSIWQLLEEDFPVDEAPDSNNYSAPNIFSFDGLAAQWIAMDIQANHGDSYTGLGEILVYESTAAASVPEPSTLALAVLGLVGLGLAGWRRRR